jgi:hypothetical protein
MNHRSRASGRSEGTPPLAEGIAFFALTKRLPFLAFSTFQRY